MNPDDLAKVLEVPVEELFQMIFTSTKKGEYFYRFLNESVVNFKHQKGVKELMKVRGDAFLVSVLPPEERPPFFEKILPQYLSGIFEVLESEPFVELPYSLSRKMVDALKKEPYAISANNYYQFGFYLSGEILPELVKTAQRDSKDYKERFYYKNIAETARGLETRMKLA